MKKKLPIFILAFFLSGLFAGRVLAQDPTPVTDNEVNAIAKQLFCPVCENTPLDVCPTEACRDWREQIRTMLSEGKSEDEILQYFTDQYGDKVRSTPPATGLNWLVYLLPPTIILIGAIFLFRSLKEWTRPKVAATATSEKSSVPSGKSAKSSDQDKYIERFEEELKKRK
jgi:cytochrome c-type biogenesis protein CcmH